MSGSPPRPSTAPSNRIVLIGGGVRSGKSSFALTLARTLGARRWFIATAQAFDDEMRARIARHRDERGREFATIEEPHALVATLASIDNADVVVVDCLTLWLSNLLLRGDDDARVVTAIDELTAVLPRLPYPIVLVTNEVGMGVVPDSLLGRRFRDLTGFMHQRLAAVATDVYLGMLGTLLRIHPAPIVAHFPGATP